MMRFPAVLISGLSGLLLFSGCSGNPGFEAPQVVYGTQTCRGDNREITLILLRDEKSWEAFFSGKLTASVLPRPAVPKVDFGTKAVLVVDGGIRPSAGYALRLDSTAASIAGRTLRLTVEVQMPDPKMRRAQMVTHPCLAFAVPAQGYDRIAVFDGDQKALAALAVGR